MALYADALKKYQTYLGSTNTDPYKQVTLQDAPSVPTSTNAESTSFEDASAPAMTGLTAETAQQYESDPYADLASSYGSVTQDAGGKVGMVANYEEGSLSPTGRLKTTTEPSDRELAYADPEPVKTVETSPTIGEALPGTTGALVSPEPVQTFDPAPTMTDTALPVETAPEYQGGDPFVDLANAVEPPLEPAPPMEDTELPVETAPEYQGEDPFQDLADAVEAGNRMDVANDLTDSQRDAITNAFDPPAPNIDPPLPPAPPGPPPEDSMDALIQQALRDLLQGQRDTAEDEAMINERVRADMLEGVVDNQARMGALGFGASGALAGMDADIRGRASRDAIDQILGVREDARDDWLRRVGTGLGADLTRREFASREAARDAYADLMRDLMSDEGSEPRHGEIVDDNGNTGEPGQVIVNGVWTDADSLPGAELGDGYEAVSGEGDGGALPADAVVMEQDEIALNNMQPTGKTATRDGVTYQEYEAVGLHGFFTDNTVWVPSS